MHIVLHAGAHCTDESRLLRTLFKNRESFAAQGISMPRPRHYRQLLLSTVKALSKRAVGPDSRSAFLDTVLELDPDTVDRVIMSSENFFCVPKIAVSKGKLYPFAGSRMAHLTQLFDEDSVELYLGIRNPAAFLPAMFAATPHTDFAEFMDGADPRQISWSQTLRQIRVEAPNVPITVWCNEDTPLIWGELVRDIAGLDPTAQIDGAFDLLKEIMSAEGMERFKSYRQTHPDMTEMQTRRVIGAFLDKFALEDALEEELTLPGWTDELVEEMTDNYEEDVYELARIPGVTFIAP